jgi:acetylornithine deacetylase/succinyl-diaminopimelate desuccinylase-like protein
LPTHLTDPRPRFGRACRTPCAGEHRAAEENPSGSEKTAFIDAHDQSVAPFGHQEATVARIDLTPDVTRLLRGLRAGADAIIADAIAICEVPAPTMAESRRAAHVARRMQELGLGTPATDAEGDVICELPGRDGRPTVMLTAHLDTVFAEDVPVTVRREGTRLFAPGIGDNSVAVAALLHLGVALRDLPDRGTLILAANVGEEGLGNLRGMKALWAQYGLRANAWLVLEGATFNRAVRTGVCSRRLEITYRAKGGHSWLDFGAPSAVHALGRLIAQIAQVRVPVEPRTTYNVGIVRGGTTVNTIAADASLVLDMRSEDPGELARLSDVVDRLAGAIAAASGVDAHANVLAERAGGRLPPSHPLIALVEEAASHVGMPVRWESASTDANVPLSHGAAAVCLGIAQGDGAHTLGESLDISLLPQGVQQVFLVAATLLRGG